MSEKARFFSGRKIPPGTTLRVEQTGPLIVVTGSVPGGPTVVAPCATINGVIILDDGLFFAHEEKSLINGLKLDLSGIKS